MAAVAGVLPWAAASQAARADSSATFQQALDGLVTGPHRIAPGVAAYVAGPGGVWSGASGVADATTGERMQPDARMRLESVSKLWAATTILQLVAQKKMRLDDTVERWLPGLLPLGKKITVRELLNHTSGLVDTNALTNTPRTYLAKVKNPALRRELLEQGQRLAQNPFS